VIERNPMKAKKDDTDAEYRRMMAPWPRSSCGGPRAEAPGGQSLGSFRGQWFVRVGHLTLTVGVCFYEPVAANSTRTYVVAFPAENGFILMTPLKEYFTTLGPQEVDQPVATRKASLAGRIAPARRRISSQTFIPATKAGQPARNARRPASNVSGTGRADAERLRRFARNPEWSN
jgi:hypothetical protein